MYKTINTLFVYNVIKLLLENIETEKFMTIWINNVFDNSENQCFEL